MAEQLSLIERTPPRLRIIGIWYEQATARHETTSTASIRIVTTEGHWHRDTSLSPEGLDEARRLAARHELEVTVAFELRPLVASWGEHG